MKSPWVLVLLCSCNEPEPTTKFESSAINGVVGMFDYSIDLPWRMEPTVNADDSLRYTPLPITFAIFDEDTNRFSGQRFVNEFCGFTIGDVNSTGDSTNRRWHSPSELSWIERTGEDPANPSNQTYWDVNDPSDPWHGICRPGVEDCARFLTVRNTSEWQAQFMLDGLAAGTRSVLELIMWVSKDDQTCASHPDDMLALRSYARLNVPRTPLPRFGDDWLYGDLHYHSQGTDNEGETGYAYRAVATTLGAMGVDFVFATEHASDSEQIVDVEYVNYEGGGVTIGDAKKRGLRDMNLRRWEAAQQFLHGIGGANLEGATFAAGNARVPRVFLGGEVDVMPEVAEQAGPVSDSAWEVPYGNEQWWNMRARSALCDGYPIPGCPIEERAFLPFNDVNGDIAYVVRDVQGRLDWAPGRQHMVYLPRFRDQPQGFVGSRTTEWGGGSRHLIENDGVLDEVRHKQGIAFLAHPLSAGGESLGPGMLPYTQYQYEKIFDHAAFAGLQLWNEDSRVESDSGDWGQTGYRFLSGTSEGNLEPGWANGGFTFTPVDSLGWWEWTRERSPASSLFNGTAQWDRLLRWGLDLGRTRNISWLAEGEPRRLFMAGGSDAHGDFNYRREGYMRGPTKSTDTALAKVRNLVEVGAPRGPCNAVDHKCQDLDEAVPGHSQDQVVEALAEGHFAVTDGPALRIVVDRNRNGIIDGSDSPMGSVVDLFPGERLPLLIEAKTTAEFGMLAHLDLYVGVDHDAEAACGEPGCADNSSGEQRSRTYASVGHGVRGVWHDNVDGIEIPDLAAEECSVDAICEMADHYFLPRRAARSMLSTNVPNVETFLWPVQLDPDQFPVNSTGDSRPTRVYVRAFARTTPRCTARTPEGRFREGCAERYAYTNPVWALRQQSVPAECPLTNRALDADNDGLPDACDLFPNEPASGGWTRAFGGVDTDSAQATAFDSQGNVYVVGAIRDVTRIEGAMPSEAQVVSQGDDAVILKYNRAGQLVKKSIFNGAGTQFISDITISGNVIHITGARKSQTMIDGVLTQSGSFDPFVARINADTLRVEWIRFVEGTGDATARAIATNASGQVVVVGDFTGQLASFQPSIVAEGSDCFIAYYSSGPTPQLQSLQVVPGSGTCLARDVAIDSTGRATAVYDFSGTVKPSLAFVRTTVGNDSIVVRYGSLGESLAVQWATTIGGRSSSKFDVGDASTNGLALASDGSVFVAGDFDGRFVVNTTVLTTSAGGRDGFVVRLAADGMLVPSSVTTLAGNSGSDAVTSLDLDVSGRLVVAVTFESSTVTLGTATLTRQGAIRNTFIARVETGLVMPLHQYSDLITFTRASISPDGARLALASRFLQDARYDPTRVIRNAGTVDGALTYFPLN